MAQALNILIVEDSANDALLLVHEMQRAGFEAEWKRVQTEEDFINALAEPPHLILSDYSMPQFDGLRAVALLRERGSDIPFILISGTLGEEAAVEAIKRGADDYLLKDRLIRLGHAVGRALEQKRLRDERKRAEQHTRAFSDLGKKLSSAKTVIEAARIIIAAADQLFGWDACTLDLYSAEKNRLTSVINMDIFDGRRIDCAPTQDNVEPSRRARRVIENGGELLLKEAPYALAPDAVPIGNVTRGSASIMTVPIRDGSKVLGILSIQSYTPKAYNEHDLVELQSLADHASGALNRIQAEGALRESERQLRQVQKMESIGQLAGGVAHDFNNILTVIQMHAAMLLSDPNLGAQSEDAAEQIALAAERAATLTRQLLTFSRKQVMQPRVVNLNELVGNVIKMLKRILGEDINLQVNYNSRAALINADPGMMEQVLLNLAVNARDAMPRGGQLIITTSDELVDSDMVQLNPHATAGNFVCLSVADTGSGISPEVLPRIFEPFFTTKSAGKGTGLGLATVYGIVQQHRGWINVYSEVGRGTVFRIYLPVVKEPSKAASERAVEAAVRRGTETVLVVEDEPAVRALVRNVLERFGYTVLEADSGRRALEIWKERSGQIALLLTDMVMPDGMTGRELAEELRADRPALKVVFTSGYSDEIFGKDFPLREGVNFLQKPYLPVKLAQTVRAVLDQ